MNATRVPVLPNELILNIISERVTEIFTIHRGENHDQRPPGSRNELFRLAVTSRFILACVKQNLEELLQLMIRGWYRHWSDGPQTRPASWKWKKESFASPVEEFCCLSRWYPSIHNYVVWDGSPTPKLHKIWIEVMSPPSDKWQGNNFSWRVISKKCTKAPGICNVSLCWCRSRCLASDPAGGLDFRQDKKRNEALAIDYAALKRIEYARYEDVVRRAVKGCDWVVSK